MKDVMRLLIKLVEVNVIRITDESFPGFVEFTLTDSSGEEHRFIDKIPIVSDDYNMRPPCIGYMRCSIVGESNNTFFIDTSAPDYITSLKEEYQFEVSKDKIITYAEATDAS